MEGQTIVVEDYFMNRTFKVQIVIKKIYETTKYGSKYPKMDIHIKDILEPKNFSLADIPTDVRKKFYLSIKHNAVINYFTQQDSPLKYNRIEKMTVSKKLLQKSTLSDAEKLKRVKLLVGKEVSFYYREKSVAKITGYHIGKSILFDVAVDDAIHVHDVVFVASRIREAIQEQYFHVVGLRNFMPEIKSITGTIKILEINTI